MARGDFILLNLEKLFLPFEHLEALQTLEGSIKRGA